MKVVGIATAEIAGEIAAETGKHRTETVIVVSLHKYFPKYLRGGN